MTNFVRDNTSLPYPKIDWDGSSTELTDPTQWCRKADWNTVCQAAVDLRGWIQTGLSAGTSALATLVVDADGRITGVSAAANGSIANAKLANMAAHTFKLNNTGGAAAPIDATATEATAELNVFTSTLKGLAPLSGGGTANFLRADGTWAAPAGGVPTSRTITATSPVRIDGGASADLSTDRTLSLANNGVTNAILAQMAANTVKLNNTGSTANAIDGTMAQLSAMLGNTLLAGPGQFGDAFDGNATFDGVNAVTGWTRSGSRYFPTARPTWYFNVVTLSSGVSLEMEVGGEGSGGGASSEFYAQEVNVISGTATIKHNGATPPAQTAATNMVTGHNGGSVGQGASGIQNAGQNASNFSGNWYNSRKAGAGGFGGASATNAGSNTAAVATTTLADAVGLPGTWDQAKKHRLNENNPGAASGGAGGGSGGGTTGIAKGGAGGNGGGVMTVGVRKKTGAGTLALEVKGGNGGPAESAVGSNAGGGSGGGGGELTLGYGGSSIPSDITTTAAGGTGGAPQGTGSTGGTGSAGQKYLFALGPGA